MNILTYIFSIIWDLGALEITKKIQLTNSLRVDDLFTTSFVNLGNPLEDIVHYLLIGGMTSLNYQDEFSMVSALVCMVTHWTGRYLWWVMT